MYGQLELILQIVGGIQIRGSRGTYIKVQMDRNATIRDKGLKEVYLFFIHILVLY